MRTSETVAAISAAFAKAQSAMGGAKKDAANPFFKSKYADLAAVMEAIAKPFADNGLSFMQSPGMYDGNICVTTRIMHESGEWIEGDTILPPTKADAQGYGSAITYGKRYGLQAMTGVPSVDDDGNAAVAQQTPLVKIDPKVKKDFVDQVKQCLAGADGDGLRELLAEWDADEKAVLWKEFNSQQRASIKDLTK
jgi:hypothetical protein